MHTCSFCKDPVPGHSKPAKAHLTIGMDKEGHVHTHGDLDKKVELQEMIEAAAIELGITAKKAGDPPKEVIFRNRQRIGDMLMFTCGVRDFKKAFPDTRVNVMSVAAHIFDHNPYVDRTLKEFYSERLVKRLEERNIEVREKNKSLPEDKRQKILKVIDYITAQDFLSGDTNVLNIGPSKGTNQSNRIDWHFANAFRISIEDYLKVQIPQGESRPDIWLTQDEYDSERPFAQPYWVICVNGEKGWGCKMYPFERWQKVIDQNPDLTFVQIGTAEDNPPRLKGANVIDHVGKTQSKETGIRDLFKLFLHAEGSIGLVSFHMHLSGALHKPCVVVAGAREPVSFTRYPYHQYLATDGTLPCSVPACWHCGINTCTNLIQYPGTNEPLVPKCVDMIAPEEVTAAIRRYYAGGRLKLGEPIAKPKLKNVAPTPASEPLIAPDKPSVGLDWGKGAIDPLDWPFIEDVIKKHKVCSVLEFGAGLSTSLMSEQAGVLVDSFETEQVWLDKVSKAAPNARIHKWDGKTIPDYGLAMRQREYDLAFVDGPANGQNREEAVRLAANHAKIVILHDATRTYESQWEKKYLAPGFQGPIKGGKWCHMWIKTASFVPFDAPPRPQLNPNKKHIRIVSTARGWGGCARSVTTIMKMLLAAGHHVEFVPFRNDVTSREFIDALKNGLSAVKVSKSYDVLTEACDVLLMYADDYVWEFPRHEAEFGNINAGRKIMMLNYRRGGVGEIPWTKGWDKYLFLNSSQEKELRALMPGIDTAVYPPCTNLEPFFQVKPDYDKPLTIVRHNSQGDTKFDRTTHHTIPEQDRIVTQAEHEIFTAFDSRPELTMHMLPGPGFINHERLKKWGRTGIPEQIADFLSKGNLFWYSLPKGYQDMGPRVILEAMAAGLPVIADNWGGAPDRVTPETGWICDSKEEMLEVIKNVTPAELRAKGEAARARALAEFRPERWMEELLGEAVACA